MMLVEYDSIGKIPQHPETIEGQRIWMCYKVLVQLLVVIVLIQSFEAVQAGIENANFGYYL
jgi:hypothetical protein